MADVAFANTGGGVVANSSSLTLTNVDCQGSPCIVVFVGFAWTAGKSVSGITYAGSQNFSLGGNNNNGNNLGVCRAVLANPQSGSNSLVVSLAGGTADIAAIWMTLNNVDTASPVRDGSSDSGGTASPHKSAFTSAVGDLLCESVFFGAGATFVSWDTGQTARGTERVTAGGLRLDVCTLPGTAGSSPEMYASISVATYWYCEAYSIRPATAGGLRMPVDMLDLSSLRGVH